MRAIILERRGAYAAVLCEDGTFVKTRRAGEVGESIELTAEVLALPTGRSKRWMRGAVAAALALAVTGGTLGYMGGTVSAYVSLDVAEDSAIELAVNHFGRVIAVNALSEDAQVLAAMLAGEVKNRRADDALDHTMEHLREAGYLSGEEAAVIAGVTSGNSKRAAELRQSVETAVGERNALYVSEASPKERQQAMSGHLSAGMFAFERDHGKGSVPWGQNAGAEQEPLVPAVQGPDVAAEAVTPAPGSADVGGGRVPSGETQGTRQEQTPQESAQGAAHETEPQSGETQSVAPQGAAPQGGQMQGAAPQGGQQPDDAARGEQPQDAKREDDPQAEAREEAPQNEYGRQEPQRDDAPETPEQGGEPREEKAQPGAPGDRAEERPESPEGGERLPGGVTPPQEAPMDENEGRDGDGWNGADHTVDENPEQRQGENGAPLQPSRVR